MATNFWSKLFGSFNSGRPQTAVKEAQSRPLPIQTPIDPLLDDIDQAEKIVTGSISDVYLKRVAGLIRAAMRDSWAYALLGVRTSGLCTLPALYSGDESKIAELIAVDPFGVDGFSRVFPLAERTKLVLDSITLGVGVAQFVVDTANDRKFLVHRVADHLSLRMGNQWFYGAEKINPGDGSWIMISRGFERPWLSGNWPALCRAATKRMLGEYNRLAFIAALANGVNVIHAPLGVNADEIEDARAQWSELGTNNVKVLPPGWQAELLEIKSAVGSASFDKAVSDGRDDISMIICGQTVTATGGGGSGFQNIKYFDAIRQDLSTTDAALLDACIDQQVMPFIAPGVSRRTDLTNDNAKVVAAQRYSQAAAAIQQLKDLFADELDMDALVKQFAIPLKGKNAG